MQLTGPEIARQMKSSIFQRIFGKKPNIVITPYDPNCLGSNSYDLHLADTLRVYKNTLPDGMKPIIEFDKTKQLSQYSMRDWFDDPWKYSDYTLRPEDYDPRNPKFLLNPFTEHETIEIKIPECGAILNPMIGYLGSTVEYTETRKLFPYIDGKSSIGRNFILNHHTAGRGDDGFCGQWTLEIRVLYPTLVMTGMRIGQIYYEKFTGRRMPYDKNPNSHYNGQIGATPAAIIPIEKTR